MVKGQDGGLRRFFEIKAETISEEAKRTNIEAKIRERKRETVAKERKRTRGRESQEKKEGFLEERRKTK